MCIDTRVFLSFLPFCLNIDFIFNFCCQKLWKEAENYPLFKTLKRKENYCFVYINQQGQKVGVVCLDFVGCIKNSLMKQYPDLILELRKLYHTSQRINDGVLFSQDEIMDEDMLLNEFKIAARFLKLVEKQADNTTQSLTRSTNSLIGMKGTVITVS